MRGLWSREEGRETSFAEKAAACISASKTSRGGLRYRTKSYVMGRQEKRYPSFFQATS